MVVMSILVDPGDHRARAVPATASCERAKAVLKEDLFRMRDAIDQYYADKNQYPATLEALVTDGYLRKMPDDPFTMSATTWQTVPSEPDPNNPTPRPASTT